MAKSSPWSYDQVRKNAKDWTLQGDDNLLLLMKKIGKNLEDRCTETSDKMRQLSLGVTKVNVQLANVNNKLLALQNDHFIEHRIQDDEEYLKPSVEQKPCDTEDNKPPKRSFEEVGRALIKQTINTLDSCYEKVIIDVSDSEDEDDKTSRTIFRPINPYRDKPLPYLIGSEKWKLKWHVGINESDSEDEEKPIEDEYSDTMSDRSISISLPSNTTPSENSNYGLQSQNLYEPKSVQNPVEEVRSIQEDRFFKPPSLSNLPPIPSKTEETKIQVKPSQSTSLFNDSPPSSSVIIPGKSRPNLFDDDELPDDLPIPAQRQKGTLFNNDKLNKPPVNLFSDEPPPDDNFRPESKKVTTRIIPDEVDNQVEPKPKKRLNLFEDDQEDDFFKIMAKKPELDKNRNVVQSASVIKKPEDVVNNNSNVSQEKTDKQAAKQNLFDDSDEDLFKPKAKSRTETKPVLKSNIFKSKSLFDDDDEDDDNLFGPKVKSTVNKVKSDQSSQRKTKDLVSEKSKSSEINSTKESSSKVDPLKSDPLLRESESKNNFDPKPLPRTEIIQKEPITSANKIKEKPKELFDDLNDDSEDIFAPKRDNKSITKAKSSEKESVSKKMTKDNLFDKTKEEVVNEKTRDKIVKDSNSSVNLFDNMEDTEDIFSPKVNANKRNSSKTVKEDKVSQKSAKPTRIDTTFDDTEDMFTPKAKERKEQNKNQSNKDKDAKLFDDKDIIPPKALPRKSSQKSIETENLFDNVKDDSDDFFAIKPKSSASSVKMPKTQITENTSKKDISDNNSNKPKSKDLFGDLKDDSDDIFAPKNKPSQKSSISDKTKKLFDKSDDDSEDIFAPKPKTIKEETKIPSKRETKNVTKSKSKGLFDLEDEDDEYLFGPKPKALKEAGPKKESKPVESKVTIKEKDEIIKDEEDLFGPPKKLMSSEVLVKSKKEEPKKLFESYEDDFSIFESGKSNREKDIQKEVDILEQKPSIESEKVESDRIKKAQEELKRQQLEQDELFRKAEEQKLKNQEQLKQQMKDQEEAEKRRIEVENKRKLEEAERIRLSKETEKEKERINEEIQKQKTLEEEPKTLKAHNLLDNLENEELFFPKTDTNKSQEKKVKDVFQEENQNQKTLEEKSKKFKPQKLFDDLEDEELISPKPEPVKADKEHVEDQIHVEPKISEEESKTLETHNLLNDQENEELFSPKPNPNKSKEEKVAGFSKEELQKQRTSEEESKKLNNQKLFDDLEDDELFSPKPKPVITQISTTKYALFDEPPEDVPEDQPTNAPDFYESEHEEDFFSSKSTVQSENKSDSSKTQVNLFSDLPPEDDDIGSKESSKTVKTNVFYDDMAESFPPKEKTPGMIFPDEPPLDEEDLFSKRPFRSSSKRKTQDQPDNVQSVRDLIKSHENPEKEKPVEIENSKPLPNKLSKNLAINVNALLPGAKRPPINKPNLSEENDATEKEQKSVEEKASSTEEPEIYTTPKTVQVPSEENPQMLTGLNKSRAKILIKRRPSTRKGRTDSLRKSQLLNDEESADDNSMKQEESEVKPKEIQSKKLFGSDDEELFKEKPKPEEKKKPKSTSLFGDSEEDEEDLFGKGTSSKIGSQKVSKASVKSEKKVAKSTPVFDDPLADLMK